MMALFIIIFSLLGGVISRWHGGGFIGGSPKVLKNFVWAAPLAIGSMVAFAPIAPAIYEMVNFIHAVMPLQAFYAACGAIFLALCMIGKATGHGGGMDLGHNPKEPGKGRKPEKLEYLIIWLHGRIPQYWYDALLLSITGIAAMSGAALAMASVHPVAALIVAFGGAMKGLAYMIGWEFEKLLVTVEPEDFNEPTEIGEFLTGLFAYLAFALAMVIL